LILVAHIAWYVKEIETEFFRGVLVIRGLGEGKPIWKPGSGVLTFVRSVQIAFLILNESYEMDRIEEILGRD
jgi:hypothetical protein